MTGSPRESQPSAGQELKIALLQADLVWQDPAANRRLLADRIAAAAGNDLIILPETFSTGFTLDAESYAEPVAGATSQWMVDRATQYSVSLCGSIIVADEGRHYNRLLWATPDGQLLHYDKRHLFRMGGENQQFTAGRERLIAHIGAWRICPMVCYDLRFPVWSRNRDDYDLLLYVANWPQARQSAWTTLLPARAVENLCFVAGVNRSGTDGNGVESAGGSMIVDYIGKQLAVAGEKPTTLTATLSLGALQAYRTRFPAWQDADDFTLHTGMDDA